MLRRALAIAAVAISAGALAASAPAARDGGYATIVTGSHLGGGKFAGKVRTPAKKVVKGVSVRRRCADRRRIDTGTRDGTVRISVRTSRKGRWSFTLPEEPGRTIKVFVLAKRLPGGGYCKAAKLRIFQPEPS